MTADPRNPLRQGIFIVLEGIDGCGKSTQIERLAEGYRSASYRVVKTREPTDGVWGRKIRQIAMHGREGISSEQELEMFLKDREEHVAQVIVPALEARHIVLSDRYYYSTIAYQGALGIDPARIRQLNEAKFPRPDLVILLDTSPEVGISRILQGRGERNNQGFEQAAYLHQVRRIFKDLRADPVVREVDCTPPPGEVYAAVKGHADELVQRFSTVQHIGHNGQKDP